MNRRFVKFENDGNYQDQQLKKGELYYGYPDGKIEMM